ncbi:lipocalin family protein [Salinisphaera sp. SPP-AMP-43]|uniref:lipocalin family protein n=1 Tax=Salinisphaera sp. SPP-AMP-43 TaxID=3121288 RepID=UPI003C6E9A68
MISFMNRSFGFSTRSITPAQSFPREQSIDLDRYMRDWYVIAHIPPSITQTAYDSIERYRRADQERIDVTFTFRKGGFQKPQKTMRPTGFVVPDTGQAVWAMQFIWPIKMQFVIAYVDADYTATIVARERRDFVWIMASQPEMDAEVYAGLVQRVADLGYDTNKLRVVPQQSAAERASEQ